MNDRIDAGEVDLVGIANVTLDDREVRMRLDEIAEPHDVEGNDLVASLQELGNEYAPFIAACSRHEYLHLRCPRHQPVVQPDLSSGASAEMRQANTIQPRRRQPPVKRPRDGAACA